MNTEILIPVILILLIVLVALWITIGVSLVYGGLRSTYLQRIEHLFAVVASQYLYPLPGEKHDLIRIQRAFRKMGITRSRPGNVQYLQDLMLRTQRTLLGKNYLKLETLYKQIPPYKASLEKLNSKKWYIKARGIREIYEMDQKQYIKELIRERNNKNLYVRREAQIAMVVFLGWNSLRFLPYLKREMTLWQQIKIVEKLHDLHPLPDLTHLRRAYDSEKPYATELIMRIIRKFRLVGEADYILRFLDHEKFDTRESAIYCISSFELDDERLDLVKEKIFRITNTEQQVQLIKYISKVSSRMDLPFYQKLLRTGNDIVKLCTAEILWNEGYVEQVQEFYYEQYTGESLEV